MKKILTSIFVITALAIPHCFGMGGNDNDGVLDIIKRKVPGKFGQLILDGYKRVLVLKTFPEYTQNSEC